MKFALFLLILLLSIQSPDVISQQSFVNAQREVFQKSQQQWLCQELIQLNQAHFKCDNKAHHWDFPTKDSCLVFGEKIFISKQEKDNFRELIFPSGDCKQYLTLLSLCDLYFPLFKRECTNTKIHDDFRILPLILSGCNQSFADGTDKTGLWALDFLVARKYHLRVDSLIDERKGGDFTTKVATQYIHELNQKFDTDNFLTTIAYLKGVPYTSQLPKTNNTSELLNVIDHDTRSFILFLAYFKEIISTTRTDNQLNNYFDIMANFEPLLVERKFRMEGLCEVLQLNQNAVRQFNPVYTGAFVEPGYRKVPFMIDRVASLKFEAFSDSIYNWSPRTNIMEEEEKEIAEEIFYYKVKRGDSLGKIAEKNHVTIKDIKKWNNIKGDKIAKGQKLKLYRQIKKSKKKPPVSENREIEKMPIESDKLDTQVKPDTAPDDVIIDNTAKINTLNTEADALISSGKLQQAITKLEEILKLDPQNAQANTKLITTRKKLTDSKKSTDLGTITYTVKSGDSLWKIAKKYPGVTDKEIMKWNKCGEDIKPGQKLIIHIKKK